MFECKGCGAYLRFDIVTQKLKCDHCDSTYDVDEMQEIRTAAETADMEVYSFQCPQCGGTIYGDRQDMTGFCRYCGTPVELAGRLTTMECPKALIPFRKTKEDCKKIFQKMASKNPFLSREYKDAEHIDGFRGIYMPYYLYHVDYDGAFRASAKGESRRRGDYIYTDRYRVEGELQGAYEGFEHDSSSTFSDEISEAIGPFLTEERREFKAGYLSGFYADASDEQEDKYEKDAGRTANRRLHKKISALAKKQKRALEITNEGNYLTSENRKVRAEKVMYPVWFLSYRNGDRVAYAAVNGQTGKITADLPIDYKRFLIASAGLMIPIFLLLNRISFLKPIALLAIYGIGGVLTTYFQHWQARKIMERDGISLPAKGKKKEKKAKKKRRGASIVLSFYVAILAVSIFALNPAVIGHAMLLLALGAGLLTGWFAVKLGTKKKLLEEKGVSVIGLGCACFSATAVLTGFVIIYLKPVSDLWYYGGALILLGSILSQLLVMVKNHNYLATRKPLQFNKEGGDDRA